MSLEYRSRGQAIARSLADIGTFVLDSQEAPVAQALLSQYFESRGVVYIIIRDKQGTIKYHTFSGRVPVELSTAQTNATPMIRDRKIRDLGAVFDIVEPIHGKSGGAVQVGMDEEWLNSLAIHAFFTQQLVVFFVFLCTIGFAYTIVRKISSPLKTLTQYAEDLSNSDFLAPLSGQKGIIDIGHNTTDEVSDLATTFVQLENQLIAYIKNLRDTTSIKEKIESELGVARTIQMNMVPRDFPLYPHRKELGLYAIIEPAKAVGGDFYDFLLSEEDNTLSFSIGDVSGKGIPAALFMAITTTLIKATSGQVKDPAKVIEIVNKKLCDENKSGLFVTVFYGTLDLNTGHLKYTIGGHNPPYIVNKDGVKAMHSSPGLPMGIDDSATYQTEELQLYPSDMIYLYTDGVTECRNLKGDFYNESGLEARLKQTIGYTPAAVCEHVLHDLQIFSRGTAQSDDVTMATIHYKGTELK